MVLWNARLKHFSKKTSETYRRVRLALKSTSAGDPGDDEPTWNLEPTTERQPQPPLKVLKKLEKDLGFGVVGVTDRSLIEGAMFNVSRNKTYSYSYSYLV